MPLMRFSKGAAMFDVTPIENMFLLEYMPGAPEGFLRVYLYARMLCLHPELGETLADIAKALNIDEDTAFVALGYWEQQGLVERISDNPPSYEIKPIYGMNGNVNAVDQSVYRFNQFHTELQNAFDEYCEKAGREEKYILRTKQFQMAHEWLDPFGMEEEAVIRIVRHQLQWFGGKSPDSVFKRSDQMVKAFADEGLRTSEEVKTRLALENQINAMTCKTLDQLGIYRNPTQNELDCVCRWITDWKCSDAEILAACGETTKSRAPSIAYLNKILEKKHEGSDAHFDAVKAVLRDLGAGGIPTPDQMKRYGEWLARGFEPATVTQAAALCARRRRGSFAELENLLAEWYKRGVLTGDQAKTCASQAAQTKRANPEPTARKFNYQQHTYTEDDFGKDFYYDPAKDYGKGENQ